jgi:predicted methyltransferase
MGPLLTLKVHETLRAAARARLAAVECSLDLDRSRTSVEVGVGQWRWQGISYPFLPACKDRTIYYWNGQEFAPVARYTNSLIKLVPTQWGAPTFEIDGIKMLPTAKVSPYEDAQRKVGLIRPRGKAILDTCGGLGYFAAWCLQGQAGSVLSFEKNADVVWLRGLNPWSPVATAVELELTATARSTNGGLSLARASSAAAGGEGQPVGAAGLPVGAAGLPVGAAGLPVGAAGPTVHGSSTADSVSASLLASGLTLVRGDVAAAIGSVPDRAFDAVLHDPPRFGIAGELYSQAFYDHLARVLRPRGLLFHYTGTPNKLTTGRDVPKEVASRLRQAGFSTEMELDGVLAVRR